VNSQQLFWIYLVGGLVLLLFFLSGRKAGKAPSKLNLRAPSSDPSRASGPEKEAHSLNTSSSSATLPPSSRSPQVELLEPEANANAKNLNVIFMYNGHDWDAYAVIGVPAGTPLPLVTQKYQEALKDADPAKFEFLEQAYFAILDSTKGRRL